MLLRIYASFLSLIMGLTWLQFYADPKNQLGKLLFIYFSVKICHVIYFPYSPGAKDRDQNRSEAKTFPIPDHLLNGQDLRFPIEKDPSKGIITLIFSVFLGLFSRSRPNSGCLVSLSNVCYPTFERVILVFRRGKLFITQSLLNDVWRVVDNCRTVASGEPPVFQIS